MTDVLLYSRGEPQSVSYTGGDRERPEEDRGTWSYNDRNKTSSRYKLSSLTEDLLHVIEFPERPAARVTEIVLKHGSSELLQGGPVVENQPDVVAEQGADADGEEERHHEHKQNVIPRESQIVNLISARRNTYLAAPRFL